MVIKSLDINTGNVPPFESGTYRLIIELSPTTLSVLLWHNAEARPVAAEVFTNEPLEAQDWEAILQRSVLLRFTDAETLFVSALSRAMPIPMAIFKPEDASEQLALIFGNTAEATYTGGDIIAEQNLLIAWQIPADWHNLLSEHFKVLQYKHLLSMLCKKASNTSTTNGNIVVYGQWAWATITQNDVLQIARPIHLQQPDDLSYHLLNTCQQLGISPDAINWQVSGLAEFHSPIWEAIAKYFQHVNLRPAECELPNELPAHYFAHLYPTDL